MGIVNEAIVVVGESFDTEEDIIDFMKHKSVHTLSVEEVKELSDSVFEFFEDRQHKHYPTMDSLNLYTGNGGYYIGYNIIDINPEQMIKNIIHNTHLWKNLFTTEPKIVTEVRVG